MATQRERSDLIAQVREVAASIRNVSDSPRTVRQQFRADYADTHTDLRSRSVELCVFDGRTYHQEQDAIHNHLNALENIVSALVDKPDEAVADLESVRNSVEEAILDMPVDEELLHDLDSGNAEARHDDPMYLVAKGEKMVLAFKEVELAVTNLLVEVKSVNDWTAIADTEEDLRKVVAHMEACVVMLRHGVIHLGLASDTVTLVEQLKHVGVFRMHALRLNNRGSSLSPTSQGRPAEGSKTAELPRPRIGRGSRMMYLCLVLLWLLVAYSDAGHSAEIHKWVDKDGKVHYSDSPPPDVVTEKIEPPPAASKEGARRTQARTDLLIEQQRASTDQRAQEREEKRLRQDIAEEQAIDRAILCSRARRSLYALLQPRAAFTTNERGERVYIPDTFRQAEIEEQKRVVAANCE